MAVAAAIMAHVRRRRRHAPRRGRHRHRGHRRGDSARTACLQADARGDDPGGRGRLGARPSQRSTSRWRPARRSTDLDVLGNLGNAALQLGDDGLSSASTPGAVAGSRGRCRHGGGLRAAAAVLRSTSSPATGLRFAAARRKRSRSAPSMGQRAMTAPPLAWLTLLAALQGRDDYDTLLRRPRGGRGGAPAGHPDRPGARPDPLGQGQHARRLRATPSAPCTTCPGSGFRSWPGWPLPSASTQPSAPANPNWLAAGSTSSPRFAEATGRPWALATVAYGRAVTG